MDNANILNSSLRPKILLGVIILFSGLTCFLPYTPLFLYHPGLKQAEQLLQGSSRMMFQVLILSFILFLLSLLKREKRLALTAGLVAIHAFSLGSLLPSSSITHSSSTLGVLLNSAHFSVLIFAIIGFGRYSFALQALYIGTALGLPLLGNHVLWSDSIVFQQIPAEILLSINSSLLVITAMVILRAPGENPWTRLFLLAIPAKIMAGFALISPVKIDQTRLLLSIEYQHMAYLALLLGFGVVLAGIAHRTGKELYGLSFWQNKFHLLLESLPFPTFVSDQYHIVRLHNKSFAELFSRLGHNVVGRHLRDILGKKAYGEIWHSSDCALKGETTEAPTTVVDVQNQEHEFIATFHPDSSEPESTGLIVQLRPNNSGVNDAEYGESAVLDELTVQRYLSEVEHSRKRIQEQAELLRQQSEELVTTRDQALAATQAKSAFLANMSHELRTPLNGIVTMASLLCEEQLSANQHEYADIIKISSDALLTIINDVLDFSKIEAGKLTIAPHPFSLRETVRKLVSLLDPLISAKEIVFIQEIEPEIPDDLIGDDGRIRQVIINLLSNAIKFTPQGGAIILYLQLISTNEKHANIRISVADTGIGIAKEKQNQIFGAFDQEDSTTSRNYGGTGLGLSISRRLVELMDGEMWLNSTKGVGSCFSFKLNLERQTDKHSLGPQREPGHQDDALSLLILVAEDNAMNQRVMSRLLNLMGHSVELAENGQIALDKVLAGNHYDVILMDCHMTELDGYSATRAIRKFEEGSGGHIPIIGLTAAAMQEELDECLNCGMDEYVSKPVPKAVLQEKLQYYARKTRTEER